MDKEYIRVLQTARSYSQSESNGDAAIVESGP